MCLIGELNIDLVLHLHENNNANDELIMLWNAKMSLMTTCLDKLKFIISKIPFRIKVLHQDMNNNFTY